MKEPKAISLFNLLNNKELTRLEENLVRDNKKRLLELVNSIKGLKGKAFEEENKSTFYQILFDKAYSKDKDYLLRNEFRLLSDQVEKVLIEAEAKEELDKNLNQQNYYLLLALQSRKALDLFDKEYKNAYQSAIEQADYFAAHAIAGLNFFNQTQFHHLKEKDIPFVEKLNDNQLTNLSSYYLAAFRTHQINAAITRSFIHPFSIYERELTKEIEVNFSEYENDYSGYLYLKAKSFLVSHEERIVLLLQCLVFLENKKGEGIIFDEELKFAYRSLANSYSLLFDFENASKYFEMFFSIPMAADNPQRLDTVCDYITKLIKLDKIEEAIDWIEKDEKLINQIDKLKVRIHGLAIACYAINGDAKKLKERLPIKLSEYSFQSKYFYKFYFSILAYLEGRQADAYRENQNFIKAIGQKKLDFEIRPILKFFNRFYNIINTFLIEDSRRENYLQKLSIEISTYSKDALPEHRAYLPFIWLKKELNKNLSSLDKKN